MQGIFPGDIYISKVTLVDRGGDAIDPCDYRPISTLSPLAQSFENLVCKHLENYREKHKILLESQFGFRKRAFYISQVIAEIADNLRKAIVEFSYTAKRL